MITVIVKSGAVIFLMSHSVIVECALVPRDSKSLKPARALEASEGRFISKGGSNDCGDDFVDVIQALERVGAGFPVKCWLRELPAFAKNLVLCGPKLNTHHNSILEHLF